jgi:hypothetical protein
MTREQLIQSLDNLSGAMPPDTKITSITMDNYYCFIQFSNGVLSIIPR